MHFSEDPTITRFVPHGAATVRQPEAFVWAVDHARAPDYWFPRDCPRALVWTLPTTTAADRDRVLGPGGGERAHVVEHGWMDRFPRARLFAYRFPAEHFTPFGDLLRPHREAGIQLRLLDDLWGSGTRWSAAPSGSAASACATPARDHQASHPSRKASSSASNRSRPRSGRSRWA
ncbi:DUF6886 family protein [Actinokineospora iranica]|uniref:DUF6886 family protein n=1 Tax=Actinokineospora iranica TaxID=1271860 RepID=UPI001E3AAE94|nr:DUF6886 family protein [Actinokineospora iranica]